MTAITFTIMNKIIELLHADPFRMKVIDAVASLNLPDVYVAAGFVRNLVWDYLHGYSPTALNDIDVVFYSKAPIYEQPMRDVLTALFPNVNWELKNQAVMHLKNGDLPYTSTAHAMEYWPELETAIGVRMESNRTLSLISPFGLDLIFKGFITHNKNRSESIFLQRVVQKKWLERWPNLKVVTDSM